MTHEADPCHPSTQSCEFVVVGSECYRGRPMDRSLGQRKSTLCYEAGPRRSPRSQRSDLVQSVVLLDSQISFHPPAGTALATRRLQDFYQRGGLSSDRRRSLQSTRWFRYSKGRANGKTPVFLDRISRRRSQLQCDV